jgi:signal transduction histidine kinase
MRIASIWQRLTPRAAVAAPLAILAVLVARAARRPVRTSVSAADGHEETARALKLLSERLLVIQEEERTRIAREIHDDLGQALTALKMDVLGMVARVDRGAPVDVNLRTRVLDTLEVLGTSVQRIAAELRPSILDDLGLLPAIESEARSFEHRTGIECEVSLPQDVGSWFSTAHTDNGTVDQAQSRGADIHRRAVTIAIYRIVQEALTNVARHSNATRVELRMRMRADDILIDIRDDGRGITSQQIGSERSLGLIGIRERAALIGGHARFEGVAGRGTIVLIVIPVSAGRAA